MGGAGDSHQLLGVPVARQKRELLGVPVELWQAVLPETLPGEAELRFLSQPERTRVARVRIRQRAAAGAWSRLLVRAVLGAHLDLPPGEVPIYESPRGKPLLGDPSSGRLHFNVSHSGQHWLAVVTHALPVGVDIESRREFRDAAQLAARAFAPDERAEYEAALAAGLSPSDAFLRVWTSVEARSKAIGSGIDRHGARAVVGLSKLPWCSLEPLPGGNDLVAALAVLR